MSAYCYVSVSGVQDEPSCCAAAIRCSVYRLALSTTGSGPYVLSSTAWHTTSSLEALAIWRGESLPPLLTVHLLRGMACEYPWDYCHTCASPPQHVGNCVLQSEI